MKEDYQELLSSYEEWIKNDSLDSVVSKVHYIYLQDPQSIDGDILGLFAKRLIDSEVEVGGPYVSKDDVYTNTLIARLFTAMNAPLEKLELFLKDKQYTPKDKTQELALSLSTKNPIVSPTRNKLEINKSILISKTNAKNLSEDIKKQALSFINKILKNDDKSEISMISPYVHNSLLNKTNADSLEKSYKLGAANIFAWIAYTIYDDFIDEESSSDRLSLANIMHRLSYAEYLSLFPAKADLINKYYDSVDNANFWELKNCRAIIDEQTILIEKIPKYGNGAFLAERSIGHVLGPKLLIGDANPTAKQTKIIDKAFNQYLIAKQINDDLADWKLDIRNGHLSYVVSKLLLSEKAKTGKYNVETLIDKLKSNFLDTVYEDCLKQIIKNLQESHTLVQSSGIFKQDDEFSVKILLPLKNEVESSLQKHLDEKKFLQVFS